MKSQATQPSWIHHIFLLVAIGVLTLSSVTLAAVPQQLHYQGVLTDDNGDMVDCPDPFSCNGLAYDMTFRLYDQAQGGTVLWEEKHDVVSIRTGLFNLELGSFVPIQGEILSSGTVYLGLTINDTPELQPRPRVVAAAFSIRSGLAENAVNAQKLAGKDANEYVSGDDLSKVLSDKGILDGDNDTLATLSCDIGDMPVYDGGGWTCQPVLDNDTLMALACAPNQVAHWTGQEWTCTDDVDTTLSDAQVAQIAADAGFATLADLAVVATTGQYADLLGIPTALTELGTTADGDLSFAGEPVISQTGQWVGDPTGLVGPVGKDGSNGADGKDGKDGINGKDGANGLDGEHGNDGTTGLDGANGLEGPTGKDGGDGATGKAGKNGKDGATGIDGKDGANGLEGPTGKDGGDGVTGKAGKNGIDGKDGISVASTIVSNSGQLVITLTNGSTTTSESLVGQPGLHGEHGNDGTTGLDGTNGKDGAPGTDGNNGLNGANGIDGEDGVSVASTFVNDAHQLVITLTDGSNTTSANLRGAKGEKGNDGTVGLKGKDGISVASAIINNAGQLVITRTNGNTTTNESLVGQPGVDGVPGLDGKDGTDGKDGINGVDGKDGAPGMDGENGFNGADGKDGTDGKDGLNGPPGKNGINGKDGADGADGLNGPPGNNGINGNDGADGLNGPPGKNGINGKDGADGINGAPGLDGVDGKDGEDGALAGLTCPLGDVVRMTATGWDCSPTVALGHNHDEAYVKNTGGTVTGDLIVNGKLTAAGGLDIDVSKLTYFGVKQVNDEEPTTYPVSLGRYHMQLSYSQYYRSTKKVPQEIIDEYCGDEDGCRMVMSMRHYSSASHEAHIASTTFRFFYETNSGKWRREYPGASGIDGQNGLQHVKTLYGACYFTDTVYIDGKQQGDNEKGMHLLYWVGYINNGLKKCELTIMD